MNPWPWLALFAIGMTGSVAALPPAIEELEKLIALDERGETPSFRYRLISARWALLGTIFSLVAVAGGIGLVVYHLR